MLSSLWFTEPAIIEKAFATTDLVFGAAEMSIFTAFSRNVTSFNKRVKDEKERKLADIKCVQVYESNLQIILN